MIRRVFYLLLATVILGGLGGGIYYWSFKALPAMIATSIATAPRPPETVSAESTRTDTWQPQIAGIGTLTAVDGIDITPEVGGIVREVHFDSGQAVKKGDLLVKLDTATDEADLRSFQAQLANAQSDLDRKQGLADKGLAPQTEIDQLRSQRDSLAANVDRTKAVIAQKLIYAPWDGRVDLRTISVGSYLAPGQKIVWLQKIDPIYADFTVTEADYGRIRVGQKTTASFNAWPEESFAGEILTTDARLSNTSRTLTVRAKLANADGRLLPGMYANVVVDAGAPQQVVTVPQTAVTFSLYGDNVLVVVPAAKFDAKAKPEELAIERRFVKAGAVRDGRVEIVDGLKPGDQVVTAGQNKVDQGSKVVVNNSIALKANDTTVIQ
ncbi:MAG: efflux RND transporter periplasmic adaptor subunit [Rhizobiales bacterium]|nr:efflux RND transporter periplasmic adaptor subunit [Hyphomicrobiales bacterium]MBI3674513.1 efflux RND transporter periplasmic adaptor subunit [Hyphomicrobiales bacterium]